MHSAALFYQMLPNSLSCKLSLWVSAQRTAQSEVNSLSLIHISSLNMLKDTNVDAIKLDMKRIDMNQENRSKGVQIVESVVDLSLIHI